MTDLEVVVVCDFKPIPLVLNRDAVTQQPLITAVHSIEVEQLSVDKRLLLFDIPGQGNKTKDYCGHKKHVDVCPCCNKAHPHNYQCKNYACPVCYPFAAMQGADRAATKMFEVKEELRALGIFPGYVNHIMISLPDDRLSEFLYTRGKNKGKINFEKLREYFYKLAQIIGVSGGYLVIHAGRAKDELEYGLLAAQELYGEEYPRIWKGILGNVYDLDDWREYVKFGLHAHITGYFKIPVMEDGTKYTSHDFYNDSGGCVYKNITVESCKKEGKPVNPETFESLKAIMTYELGHHAYQKGKNAYTPFGFIKDWKKEKISTEYFYEKCEECGTEKVQISPLEYENFLKDSNSVDLENKKKVLRGKPIIRYTLRKELRDVYLQKYQKTIAEFEEKLKIKKAEEEEKIKAWLEKNREIVVVRDPPVKKPLREFVPYKVKADHITQRIACIYAVNR